MANKEEYLPVKGSGGDPIVHSQLITKFVQVKSLTKAREEQAARQSRMDRLLKERDEESSKLLGAEARKRDALLSVAVHKDSCNNNVTAVPPSQVVRSDTVLPILVEGDVGSVEAYFLLRQQRMGCREGRTGGRNLAAEGG